ncbi:MAG: hypothetical protein CR974_04030 [Gammaproteobacteria bacterium]|nr:MAG: hypothetical protein CR974_04030 [Gammaproteobacteria bacterium]
MKKKLLVLFLATSAIFGGCQSRQPVVRIYPRKPLCPVAPIYPKLTDKELASISDETYQKLVDNFVLRDAYIRKLKVYCDKR